MSEQLDLYKGRPGFADYEGFPTRPELPNPEGWDKMTLDERLAYTLQAFDDDDAKIAKDPYRGPDYPWEPALK